MSTTSVPLIGVPARMDRRANEQKVNQSYIDAVVSAGGMPVVLPLLPNPGESHRILDQLDGVLLPGSGTDVDPAAYGAAQEPGCGPIQPLHEKLDFRLMQTALSRHLPVLAICFGMQSLNVFMGGTLIQDIAANIGKAVCHGNPNSKARPFHTVELLKRSVLEPLAGTALPKVNSSHHQAVEKPGRSLEVIATAQDGIIEAVWGTMPDQWLLGVQWHPERSYASDVFSRRIFELFVTRCRAMRVDL